jgi:hypothetical protein
MYLPMQKWQLEANFSCCPILDLVECFITVQRNVPVCCISNVKAFVGCVRKLSAVDKIIVNLGKSGISVDCKTVTKKGAAIF